MVNLKETEWLRGALLVLIVALCVRVVCAWALGEGAPFGPDGTGAEAAVFLGGHPYPLHIAFLHLTGGSARALSMASGSISAVLLWQWGRRAGLGGTGGWLAAFLPLTVFTSVIAAGDAPALTVVLLGAVIAQRGGPWAALGGGIAALSVVVKPIALPAMVLLLSHPVSILGALPVLVLFRDFTRPLWEPMPDGGILGSWWVSSTGDWPTHPLEWIVDGWVSLAVTPAWACTWLLVLGFVGCWRHSSDRTLRMTSTGPMVAAWVVAALFGERLEARYLAAAVAVSLPFVGALFMGRALLQRVICLAFLWPTLGLVTQLSIYRASMDTQAVIPQILPVPFPIDVQPLFDACSTADATRLRALAFQIAEVAPEGATIITEARPDGREGELFWPLLVLRPDLKVQAR